MESFDPRLFRFQAPLLLLYGDQSELRVQDRFGWPDPGWEKPFQRIPEVSWIPGAHGQFFHEPNLPILGDKVRRFFHD
jgi:hypothetical protein